MDILQKDETSQPINFCTSLCNPLQHHMIQQHTSGNNHSPPSPICILQLTSYEDTEIDTPKTNNHVEPNNLPCVVDDNPVPEPMFTIDLDIETSLPEYSPNENIIQLSKIPSETHHQHVPVNNYTYIPNGNTSDTCTGTHQHVDLPQPENNSPPETHGLHNNLPSDIEENTDYYGIQTETTNPNENNNFTPIINYSRDKLVHSDVQEVWERIQPDIIPDHGPFTDTQGLSMSTNSCEPEDFFNDMFDDRMFTIMAEETNNYATKR